MEQNLVLDLDKVYGMLAAKHCNQRLELTVLKSNAGFYIGTVDSVYGLPCSRESDCYWPSQVLAQQALDTKIWPQKQQP